MRRGAEHVGMAVVGACSALAWAFPAWWIVSVLGMVVLVTAVRHRPWSIAWAYAFGSHVCALYGIYTSVHTIGGVPAVFAVLIVIGIAAALSFGCAIACAVWKRCTSGHALVDALLFGSLWMGAEWLWSTMLMRFPWALLGIAYVDSPLRAWAPWIGVYGIGWLVASLCAGIALWHRRSLLPTTVLCTSVVAVCGLPLFTFTAPHDRIAVSLIQTNTPQRDKMLHRHITDRIAHLVHMIDTAQGDIVFTPETSVPVPVDTLDDASRKTWRAFEATQLQSARTVIVGALIRQDDGIANALLRIDQTAYETYTKKHLVPFGETLPMGFGALLRVLGIPLGSFAARDDDARPFRAHGQTIAVSICFEDAYGDDWARLMHTTSAPTMLANASNLGWFGHALLLHHHEAIARMRALEFQRPFVRAGNVGPTLVVDAFGTVQHRLPVYTSGIVEAAVYGRTGMTPYARWLGTVGYAPIAAPIGLCALVIVRVRKRRLSK
ncbi:MAG: apolipoprotein N-acyltransferase [Paenibacillaceae bacterium]|nr:apolipoprotein N-acyltransferase [Paenibacillaceae bacterium]